ncbi:MAG: alpha-glycosidase [Lachnospiraceae bacterium]|nr:alpha-glycosidase [Lachnospiraceae bacterium]
MEQGKRTQDFEKKFLASVYSDGTRMFVSNPTPELFETVKISIRFLADAPVKRVLIRSVPNGTERYDEAVKTKVEKGLCYFTADFKVTEYHMNYQFHLVCDDVIYFYTQAGITTYIPDHTYDFKLLADYRQPDWVKGAVFYQIFPERFANGNTENDVQTGEYEYQGAKSYRYPKWEDVPLPPEEGRAVDFYGGDLDGIRAKIPYLKDLGVTAIYINPIFTAFSTHKYDCCDYFHVDPHFGGDEALERLCQAVHENDMKIILDISINHTGIEHHWIHEEKPYYFKREDGSYQGWFDVPTLPVLDYRSEELRDVIYRGKDAVLRKWLRPPYQVDGWRFDVADVFARNNEVQLSDELWPEICAAIREENPDAFIIGEDWGDCGKYLQGNLWNTPMNYFGFGRVIRQFLGLPDLYLERNEILNAVPYQMTAEDVAGRTEEHYAKIPSVIADCQMNLFDSHDIARIHNYETVSFEQWKSAVIAQFFWRGIPCIYYGDEVAIDGYTWHDAGFRYPMPWGDLSEEGQKHLALYKKMIALRKEHSAFSEGSSMMLHAEDRMLVLSRFSEKATYIAVISMEDTEKRVSIPLSFVGAKEPVGSEDYFGESLKGQAVDGGYLFDVKPFGAYVFEVR